MPSFRVTLVVGALRAGVAPSAVLPAATSAGRELTTVEASDVAVVSGEARLTVRFTADDAEIAAQVADHIAAVTSQSAEILGIQITERRKTAWLDIRW